MVRFTEGLGAQYGVRAICGKGGFPDEAIEPMQRLGMVYFAIVGGAAALETTQIEEIEEVAWEELMPECLWKFRVKDFGPLTVGIDAHGNSLYHDVQDRAQEEAGGALCPALTATASSTSRTRRQAARAGLTHVIDKGLNLREIEGMFDTAGDYVDIVKLGWGTSYVTNNLEKKIALYRSFDDAGRLRRHALRGGLRAGQDGRVQALAASTTASRTSRSPTGRSTSRASEKLELIADFARDFTVLSEVGSKDAEVVYRAVPVGRVDPEELDAGPWKVITEGREGGTAGIYRPTGEMRTGSSTRSSTRSTSHDLIFEAPTKSSQAWFVKHFGPEVNLGNIPPDEVIPLETLRLGLRGDTLQEILVGEAPAPSP